MKKIFFTLSLLVLMSIVFAQTPQSFKYQSVIRNGAGDIIPNQNIGIQLSILEGSNSGTSVYTETWTVTTNKFGLVSLNVGKGTTTDNFSTVSWGTNLYFLQIAVDASGGTDYTIMGASQLLSVPYALYSNQSANGTSQWLNNESTIYYNGGNVGVGTTTPSGKLVIQADDGAAPDSILFEVKDKNGIPLMRITSEGVKIYVNDNAKGAAGGFAVGRYATAKGGIDTTFLLVTPDSTRVYTSANTKGAAGGFAVGRYATAKGGATNKYFYTGIDSTRIYLNENAKGAAGGFAVGRYATAKGGGADYFNIGASNIPDTINPSEARIVWYPLKEAFLTGRVLIESIDSVGLNSMATGFESKAIGNYSQAMGYQTVAKGLNSLAIGYLSRANGVNSYAFGKEVLAKDSNCFVFGNKSVALGKGSFAIGSQDSAIGRGSMAFGFNTKAEGLGSFTMGAFTKAVNTLDVAMGYETVASGGGSTAMGWFSQAKGDASLAMGDSSVAIGSASLAMGNHTIASGASATSMGLCTKAIGDYSTAMGDSSIASGFAATAMGYRTVASGLHALAMGDRSVASGAASLAMGSEAQANGFFSVAIGASSKANGDASIAFGHNSIADGNASLATGEDTHAEGDASVTFGTNTHAVSAGCVVMGAFNAPYSGTVPDSSYFFVIGNGIGPDEASRHNAVTVLKNGNFGINTNVPDKLFTVDGDAHITGDIYYGDIGTFPLTDIHPKPDFVFNPNYKKDFKISEIEEFIKTNKHLPWLTSAKDEKDGINMTRMGFETLEAVENQQLQIIELNKKIQEKDKIINELKNEINKTNSRLKTIEEFIKLK